MRRKARSAGCSHRLDTEGPFARREDTEGGNVLTQMNRLCPSALGGRYVTQANTVSLELSKHFDDVISK